MDIGSFLAAWLAYLVVTFAMGYLRHLVLFKKLYMLCGIAIAVVYGRLRGAT